MHGYKKVLLLQSCVLRFRHHLQEDDQDEITPFERFVMLMLLPELFYILEQTKKYKLAPMVSTFYHQYLIM